MKKKVAYVFLFLCFLMMFLPSEKSFASAKFENRIIAKKEKKIKTVKIKTKKQLVKSLNEILAKGTKEVQYRIDSKVTPNFKSFEKIFWDEKNKNFIASEVLKETDSFDYDYKLINKTFFIKITVYYKMSSKDLKKFVNNLKKIDKLPVLDNKEELREEFLNKLYSLDKTFMLKVSKSLYKKTKDKFLESMKDEPKFNDLAEKVWVYYEPEQYTGFYVFVFYLDTEITKQEAAAILAKVSPIINSEEEFFREIVKKAENLEEEYSLNVASNVIDFNSDKEQDAFWNKLYDIPEYGDLSHHNEDGSFEVLEYKGYFKFSKFDKYTITKDELDNLKNFIKKWVLENIKPEMKEEEKIRAINDFMVREYRYTYGDRGELSGDEHGKEKLGKYSVYSSLALLNCGGGVCNSKAIMLYRLAKEAGLEVLYVVGQGNGDSHAWNMVKIDGNWYHIDNTWNRGHYEGDSEYEYFNDRDYYLKGDETMRKDHSWDATKYPAAPMDYQGYVPTAYNRTSFIKKAA